MRSSSWMVLLSFVLLTSLLAQEVDWPTELEADRRPALQTGGNLIIRAATVLTATGKRLESCDILVEDGRIVALGTDLSIRRDSVVYDGRGKFVIPGIVDCHSHIAIEGGVNEMADTITSEVRIEDAINHRDPAIYRALAGGTTTALLLHGSANPIGGQSAIIRLKYGQPARALLFEGAPPGIKFALGENVVRAQTRFPNTRLGVRATLVRAFTEALEYRARRASGELTRRDLRLEALVEVLEGRRQVHCHSYRADEILQLFDVAEDFGIQIATLQHVLEGYKISDQIMAHGAGASTFSDWWAYKVEAFDAIPHNAALMHRAGVLVSVNSDSADLIRRLHLEAAKSIHYSGLSEDEALRLVTANPARQLGLEEWVGTIEVGKDADLAIFDGHPFSIYSRCVLTLIQGEVYFESPRPVDHRNLAFLSVPQSDLPAELDLTLAHENERYALVGADLYPITGPPIQGGALVVDRGRIEAIGPAGSLSANLPQIEASGYSIYPGWVNTRTHLGLTEIGSLDETNDYSIAGRIQPDLVAQTGVNPFSVHIPVTRTGGVTTALTIPYGGLVPGQSSLLRLDGQTTDQMADLGFAALHIRVPRIPRQKGEDKKAAEEKLEQIEDLFDQAAEQIELASGTEAIVSKTYQAMAPYLFGRQPVIFHADRVAEIDWAMEFAEARGLRMILSSGRDVWKVADRLAEKKIPVLLGSVFRRPEEFETYDAHFRAAQVLAEAGVLFAFGTGGASNARNLTHQASFSVKFGLDPARALRALTIDAATILGVHQQIGSLEVAKSADLVITRGDPLEIVTRPAGVILRGRPIPLESRQTELRDRFSG